MPRTVTYPELVEAVAGRRSARPAGPPLLVAIDGCGGAGKTTLASALARDLRERALAVEVVGVDDFSHAGVETWDHEAFRLEVVGPALAARPFEYRVWRWDAAEPVGVRRVGACDVLVVEGVSSSATAARVPWDVTVWVEASELVRWRRLSARDGDDLAGVWSDSWWPSEQRYVEADDPRVRVTYVIDAEGLDLR
ncbi:AAA family ATPase [Micrococcales bacterium 31B]|nr:AAA family ATPase [Micrococcales bacterium 31B]